MLKIIRETQNNYFPIEVSQEDYDTIKKTCNKTALVFGATIELAISTSYKALIEKITCHQ
jgi:hypothetical protein